MSVDLLSMEAGLRQLRPVTLDPALLARLEACADHPWAELSAAESHLASKLAKRAPTPLPAALMAALESTVSSVVFPGQEKILRFPNARGFTPHHARVWWSTAAAVALIGASAAWFVPTRHGASALAAAPPANHDTLPAHAAGQLIPAKFNRGLAEARDEGIIWPANQQAQRVVKVVYLDRVTLKDGVGKTYQVEQPRVEYILVPAKSD